MVTQPHDGEIETPMKTTALVLVMLTMTPTMAPTKPSLVSMTPIMMSTVTVTMTTVLTERKRKRKRERERESESRYL